MDEIHKTHFTVGQMPWKLTDREKEILRLCAKGLTSRQIGQELCLAHQTVKNMRSGILKKLAVDNMTEAVACAMKRELI